MSGECFDVLIVGAGISGIGAAHHLQTRCPHKSYAILEARDNPGGTWDLFRYPGVRSDSDMYTFGYAFRPWTEGRVFADGDSIRRYVQQTADDAGITSHLQYGQRVEVCNWNSHTSQWELDVRDVKSGTVRQMTCRFLMMCSGYYRYDRGHVPEIPGRDDFHGDVLIPQHWPEGYDYSGKRVVIIGSGATAVTLLPAMASEAAGVTMLQRSPTYIGVMPSRDLIAVVLRRLLPGRLAHRLIRAKNIVLITMFYQMSRRFPRFVKWLVKRAIRKELGRDYDVDRHFTPDYAPWDQRFCIAPDGDFFQALKDGKGAVVTDHIERITESGIALKSGEHLEADLIVMATGLEMQIGGGMDFRLDGTPVAPADCICYRGMMLAPLPNLAVALGYSNNSWTLKIDLTCERVCRLLQYMDRHNYESCVPVPPDDLETAPLVGLTSGYVKRAADVLPKQGTKPPWRSYHNYFQDVLTIRYGKLDDGVLRFMSADQNAQTELATSPAAEQAR